MRLWIEGFDFSPEDIAKGRLGNYADLSINEQPNGKCTITFKKVERDMKFDPFVPRPKRSHPDWGWPLMRHIKSRKNYRFIEDAQGALKRYYEDYPAITRIRDKDSLYTIIWDDSYKPKPTRNFVLEVVEDGDGFIIEANESTFNTARSSPRPKVDESSSYPQQGPRRVPRLRRRHAGVKFRARSFRTILSLQWVIVWQFARRRPN